MPPRDPVLGPPDICLSVWAFWWKSWFILKPYSLIGCNYSGCLVHACPPPACAGTADRDGRRGSGFPDKIGIDYFVHLIPACHTVGRDEPLNL